MKNEIVESLVKIIQKDPIVTIQESKEGYDFFHLSGKKTPIVHDVNAPEYDDGHLKESIRDIEKDFKQKLFEIENKIPQTSNQPNGIQRDDVEFLLQSFVKQFDYTQAIKEEIKLSSKDFEVEILEFVKNIELPEKVIEQHHHHTMETVKEQYVPEEFYQRVDEKIKKSLEVELNENVQTPPIKDMEIRNNELIIKFMDGNERTLGKIRHESLEFGGYGVEGARGQTGLSAYQIAVRQGYNGTVDQWIDSLSFQPDTLNQLQEADPEVPWTEIVIKQGTDFTRMSFDDFLQFYDIGLVSEPIIETVPVQGTSIALTHEPHNGKAGISNFGTVRYIDASGTWFDAPVTETADPKIFALDDSCEWDGNSVIVQYTYINFPFSP